MKSEVNVTAEFPRISSRNANMTASLEYLYIKVYSFFTTCSGGSCFHSWRKSSYRNLYSLLSPGPFFSLTWGNTGVWDRKIVFIKYYQLHSTSRRNKKVLKALMEWGVGGNKKKTFSPICVSLLWEVNDNEIFTEEFISQSKVIFFPVNLLLLQCLFCAAPTFKLCTKKIRNISSY